MIVFWKSRLKHLGKFLGMLLTLVLTVNSGTYPNSVNSYIIIYTQKKVLYKTFHRYYVGSTPKVAITDVEIAKEIMVKEFENFSDRGFIVGIITKPLKFNCIFGPGST